MRNQIKLATLLLLTACAGHNQAASVPTGPTISRPEVYQKRYITLAGPTDSTYLVLSLSMPNSAIRFQRGEHGFGGEYRIQLQIDSAKQFERRETVVVGAFAETVRNEESIVYQDAIAVTPGRHVVKFNMRDMNSTRAFAAVDTIEVPSYPRDSRISAPVLVYQNTPRTSAQERPAFIANPRNSVPYGGAAPHLYIEAYDVPQSQPVSLKVLDESGVVLWSGQTTIAQGSEQLRHATVEIPAAALPIGRLSVEASVDGGKAVRTPFLISISDQWMVSNFGEVLRFLEYIANPVEVDSLRRAQGTQRREAWDRFWAKRDPLPATPINEFREQFFERIRIATEQFTETGKPGWDTDRGEVYIVFGAPDQTLERAVGRDASARPNLVEWLYESVPGGRLVLQFLDRGGFGHYELTPGSEEAFRTVAARMRR